MTSATHPGRGALPKVTTHTRELFSDADTPVNIFRKLAQDEHGQPRPGTFLLESADQGIYTRYSFVGADVFGVLTEENGHAKWVPNPDPTRTLDEQLLLPGGVSHLTPVAALSEIYDRWNFTPAPGLPPLASGFVGYLGWETVAEFEKFTLTGDAPESPRQYLGFVSDLAVIDHHTGTTTLIVNTLDGETAAHARARLDHLQQRLAAPVANPVGTLNHDTQPKPQRFTSPEEFHDMVRVAKERIVDGDVFQVVLAQRFDERCDAAPLDVYRVLRHLNPSPYLYLLTCEAQDGEPLVIVGSSPEALVKVDQRHVLTHPIAGSRPRGTTVEEDLRYEVELLADPKERSEHLMLVDLSRNDLSRVCEPGTVEVTEFMRIERFSHIMHISSTVEGKLHADANPVDALRATFPAGTLSGAPKPWALKMIAQLEPVRRGVYGGVVGYIGLGGHADLAIAIRTATIHNGVATVQAGAGIVYDSVDTSEEQEVVNKAAAPLRAIAIANTLTEAKTDPAHEADPSQPFTAPGGQQ